MIVSFHDVLRSSFSHATARYISITGWKIVMSVQPRNQSVLLLTLTRIYRMKALKAVLSVNIFLVQRITRNVLPGNSEWETTSVTVPRVKFQHWKSKETFPKTLNYKREKKSNAWQNMLKYLLFHYVYLMTYFFRKYVFLWIRVLCFYFIAKIVIMQIFPYVNRPMESRWLVLYIYVWTTCRTRQLMETEAAQITDLAHTLMLQYKHVELVQTGCTTHYLKQSLLTVYTQL